MDEVVIAYASKHLTDSQAKWATVEKEAYAIVFATKTFYPYLYGRRFTVFTDHKPLEWLINIKEPTGRLMRWSLMLQEYDMAIGYRPGKTNQNADSLSRAPVNQVAAPPSLGTCTLKEEQEKDEFCQKVKRTIEKKGKKSRYIVREDGLIGTSDGRVLVPLSLRLNVLRRLHDHKLAAHLGQAKVGPIEEPIHLARNARASERIYKELHKLPEKKSPQAKLGTTTAPTNGHVRLGTSSHGYSRTVGMYKIWKPLYISHFGVRNKIYRNHRNKRPDCTNSGRSLHQQNNTTIRMPKSNTNGPRSMLPK